MIASTLALLLCSAVSMQTGLPLQDPLGWWLYMTEADAPGTMPGVLPLTGSDFIESYEGISSGLSGPWTEIRSRSLRPGPSGGEFSGFAVVGTAAAQVIDIESSTETRAGATARLHANILSGLSMDEQLSLWTGSDEQPPDYFSPFHRGVEKGRHLYVDWGWLRWSNPTVAVSFGRIPQRWGPGRFTQLLISDNSPPMDMLRLQLDLWDRVEFTGLTATVDSDSGIYLTAHRLDINPGENLRIGLSESILFKASGLDFAYMNPLIPWYPVQWNERVDDNAFFSFDASWKPFRDLETYGELLIDDIQYENDGNRPNKLGWTAGITAYLRPLRLGTVLEYTRIDRYVYSQRRPCNYYLHHGDIIGSALGPDADRVTLSLGTAAAWPLLGELTLDHTRHGQGTVQEGWPDSASTGGKFPSGIVQYTTGAALHLGWYPADELEVHGVLKNDWIRNQDHVHGQSDTRTTSSLELVYHW